MHTLTVHWGEECRTLTAEDGKNLLQLLTEQEIILSAPCRGKGSCGKCRVEIGGKEVLACQTHIHADTEVWVPRTNGSGLASFTVRHWEEGGVGLGVALDIGTTTLAAVLVDCATGQVLETASMLNPQRICGADVISRIAACADGKLELQTKLIRGAAAELLEKLRPAHEKQPIEIMTICGNTTMLHLFCGVDPSPIGVAPYTPVFTQMLEYAGAALGLPVEKVFILPSASGYIGSDVVCGILAMEQEPAGIRLLADLGTNGELALMLNGEIICASTAAGPALEGANIECGTGGIPGAICAVSRQGPALELKTIGGLPPRGICGSGLVDLMAVLLGCGIIDESGSFDESCDDPLAEYIRDQRFWLTDNIWLSQKDIRQFQLAKAAIHAGIETLCECVETAISDVEQLAVAGGLGFYLREESTLNTGLIPRGFAGRIHAPGNTALAGAVRCLLPRERTKAVAIAQSIRICDLSSRADFSQRFVDAMYFE